MPISRWISVSDSADIMAPDLTLALQAATYQGGIPTHNSNQATTVGPFHRANGVPAFIASASSSCLKENKKLCLTFASGLKKKNENAIFHTCA